MNNTNNNSNNSQNRPKPDGNFEHRGGAQTPTYRKPSPPPKPSSK